MLFLLGFVVFAANVLASIAVAGYASRNGFPYVPVLIASIFLGFPLVLLAVALMPPRCGTAR